MAINPNVGGGPTRAANEFQQAREAREARLDAKVQAAVLAPAQRFSPSQIEGYQRYYNASVSNLDRLQSGNLPGLRGIDQSRIEGCFPSTDGGQVEQATTPTECDNHQASRLRGQFAGAFAQAQRERTQASRQARQLGPGQHSLANGDRLEVSDDAQKVQTTRSDGANKTVSFSNQDSSQVAVERNQLLPVPTPGHEVKVVQGSDNYLPVIVPLPPQSVAEGYSVHAGTGFMGGYTYEAVNVATTANAVAEMDAAAVTEIAALAELAAVAVAVIAVVLI